MKARFMIDEPGQVDCTMKLTMSLEDWVTLRDHLRINGTGVEYELRVKITELITKVKKVYYAEEELGQ